MLKQKFNSNYIKATLSLKAKDIKNASNIIRDKQKIVRYSKGRPEKMQVRHKYFLQ